MRKVYPSDVRKRWKRAAAKVSQKRRQEVLDSFKKEGLSIGEVAEKFSLESRTIGQIIIENLETMIFLREQAR